MFLLKKENKLKGFFSKVLEWLKIGDKLVYLEFFIVSLFVFGSILFSTGYVFALDMSFTPHLRFPTEMNSYFVISVLMWLVNLFLPAFVIQKIILLAIPFFAGVSMYRLISTESKWPKYFAAFLYIFNPFTYSRFLYGQILFLLAYALLPFVIKAIIDFVAEQNFKSSRNLILWLTATVLIDYHVVFFAIMFFAVYWVVSFVSLIKNKGEWKRLLLCSLVVTVITILLNSFWLFPFLTSGEGSRLVVDSVDDRHINVFQTDPDQQYGVFWNIAAMYGFWGDREGRYLLQKDIIPYWFELFVVIFLVVIWGAISTLFLNKRLKIFKDKKQKKIVYFSVITFLVAGIFAWFFAVGIAHGYFTPTIKWIYQNLSYFRGFREPQKFVAVLVLVYAYIGALGVNNLLLVLNKTKTFSKSKIIKNSVIWLLLILPLLYSPGILNACGGQLYNSEYPASWYKVNEILNSDKTNFNSVFFPWHGYMGFAFTRFRVVGNPAEKFFDTKVFAGDNIEVPEIYTQSLRPESAHLEGQIVLNMYPQERFGEKLEEINIKYIVLSKEAEYLKYKKMIDGSGDMELIFDAADISLYRNKKWQAD